MKRLYQNEEFIFKPNKQKKKEAFLLADEVEKMFSNSLFFFLKTLRISKPYIGEFPDFFQIFWATFEISNFFPTFQNRLTLGIELAVVLECDDECISIWESTCHYHRLLIRTGQE